MTTHDGHVVPPEVDVESLTAHLELPETRVSSALDRIVRRVGDTVSWIWPLLLGVVVLNVVLRYVFGEGRIEFEEIQWHLFAVGFLVGLSYCVESDAHVRVDFLRGRASPRLQAWIDLYGTVLLLLPFTALVLIHAVPFVASSFAQGEISSAPGGLPFRWAIKAALFAGFALLAISAVSRLLRLGAFLFGEHRND